jgi:hypothetical protein
MLIWRTMQAAQGCVPPSGLRTIGNSVTAFMKSFCSSPFAVY